MPFPKCSQAGYMHICFEKPDKVVLTRCCLRDYEILDIKTLDEFFHLDVYAWCKSHFLKNPTPHDFKCGDFIELCDYTQDKKFIGIEVAISQACNLRCPMCIVGEVHKDSPEMKQAYFKTLESFKGKGLQLRLTDRGEPFFYKKETLEFLQNCERSDFNLVLCTTNAQMLDKEYIKQLACLKVPMSILVSLDSLNIDTYKKIRGNGKLPQVLDNIKYLKESGLLHGIHTVLQEENKNEFLKIRDFAASIGVKFSYAVLWGFDSKDIESQL